MSAPDASLLSVGCGLALAALEWGRMSLERPARNQWRSELIAKSHAVRAALRLSSLLFLGQGGVHLRAGDASSGMAIVVAAAGLAGLTQYAFNGAFPAWHVGCTNLFAVASSVYIITRTYAAIGEGGPHVFSAGAAGVVALVTLAMAVAIGRALHGGGSFVALMISLEPSADAIRGLQATWIYGMLIWGLALGLGA